MFIKYLGEKKLKLTKERLAVLKEVSSFQGHFGPEDLYFSIRNSGSKASRASVYRTLGLLVGCGLVEKVSRTDRGNVYEHTYGHGHHDHLICSECGQVIEFFSENLEKLQEEVCRRNNFQGITHLLEIRGRCEKCRA